MSIRESSKKIVQMLLDIAIEQGQLRIDFQFDYEEIAKKLGLESGNYCKVCFQYLTEKGCLVSHKESQCIRILAAAVDFLDTP